MEMEQEKKEQFSETTQRSSFRFSLLALYSALFVVFLPEGLIPPDVHSILNRSVAILALVAWLSTGFAHKRLIWSATASFMLGFVIWSAFTLVWADDLNAGATSLMTYTFRFAVFLLLVPNIIRSQRQLEGLMNTLALLGWLLVLISAGIILLEGYTPGTRFKLLSENENGLGMLALVTMSGVLWQSMQPAREHPSLRRLAALVFLPMVIALVAISGSRGSAISLFITLLAFYAWKPTRRWGKFGIMIILLAAIAVPAVFTTTIDRFAGKTREPFAGRVAIWQVGWEVIGKHPVSGVGIGNSSSALVPYFGLPTSSDGRASMHNPILTIWSETGLPGIVLYLGVLISAIWSFLRQYQRHRRSGTQYLTGYFALVASLFLGYMLSWIKGGGMESNHTFFLLLGLLLIPASMSVGEPESVAKTDTEMIAIHKVTSLQNRIWFSK